MVAVLKSIYVNRKGNLTADGISMLMNIDGGSSQGMILAPRIFSFFLFAIFELWTAEHPDTFSSMFYNNDNIMTGRQWNTPGPLLLYCMFNLADDTALLFETKLKLTRCGAVRLCPNAIT